MSGTYEVVGFTNQEIGRLMSEIGCADRIERIKRLMFEAQRVILSAAGAPVEMRVIDTPMPDDHVWDTAPLKNSAIARDTSCECTNRSICVACAKILERT